MLGAVNYPNWLKPEIIPGFPYLRWYALMYLVAFAIAYLLFRYQVKRQKMAVVQEEVFSLFFWMIIGLIIGARLAFVLFYDRDGYFRRNPLQVFLPFARSGGKVQYTGFSGLSYHGGLVGALVANIIYTRVKKIDTLEWGDMLVAGIPLGYTFGRLGNFINAELFGRVTALPWGMYFEDAERISTDQPWVQEFADKIGLDIGGMAEVNLPRHPSQLYEAFFEGIFLWLILWFIVRKHKPFRGFTIGIYILGYGLVRFFIEYTRQPDPGIDFPLKFVDVDNPIYRFITPWNFTMGQILCVAMIAAAIACLAIFWRLSKRKIEEPEKKPPTLRKLRKRIK
jgi:phosphatidylglycerol:prolipoprotein diacylglycerol transferase